MQKINFDLFRQNENNLKEEEEKKDLLFHTCIGNNMIKGTFTQIIKFITGFSFNNKQT